MKSVTWLMTASALALSAPALAGEQVLYGPAPAWAAPVEMPRVRPGPPIVLYDDQRRIEEGRLTAYLDRAIRIDNPQMLTALGTVQAQWQPDKGDLVVHRVSILRGDAEIDVLGDGARFEVLRRERQLEQRIVDGSLTATLAVPGLRVGDVLRISYTTTQSDQALAEEVQAYALLPSKPFEASLARVRISWPEGSDVNWRATRGITLPEPVVEDGFAVLEVALPLDELAEVPDDAPLRFRVPPILQAGTFADWAEVSRVMGPLYATEGTIDAGGPIAGELDRIVAAHDAPLERAVAALRVVQDEIAYLLNGMQGGNYIPQSPTETWTRRYGDCKAKTLLLLAMLREMGIEAEAVAVASSTGDAVPGMLPMPGAFDHVIVHAVIDGTDYWLDGTTSGASMRVVDEVPPFRVALPLSVEGSDLLAMTPRPQTSFDRVASITIDQRAGLDVPSLYEAEWTLTAAAAAPFRGVIGQAGRERLEQFVGEFASGQMGDSLLVDSDITFDAATNTATVKARGLIDSAWEWERGRGSRGFGLPSQGFQFRPDRSRAAWRSIPVAIGGPFSERTEMTVLLPASEEGYTLEGKSEFDTELATVRLGRQARLDGNRLEIVDSAAWPGGEIAPGQVAAERQKASRFGNIELRLRAPTDAARRFDIAASDDRQRYAAIEAAYGRLISAHPDEVDNLRYRASFRAQTYDWDGALADLGEAIEREPDVTDYLERAGLLVELGRLDDALADADMAWELDPSPEAAFTRANILPYLDRVDEAIAVLEEQQGDPDQEAVIAMAISDLEGLSGRKEEGLQRIEDLLARRPNDPTMLNARCWYQATWNYQAEELVERCTEAVERADWSAPVLDSRAMGYYRLGRYEDALKDLEAALSANPELTPTLFMRGVVRRELGDRGGERDIREALARQPSLERNYARFGIRAR